MISTKYIFTPIDIDVLLIEFKNTESGNTDKRSKLHICLMTYTVNPKRVNRFYLLFPEDKDKP